MEDFERTYFVMKEFFFCYGSNMEVLASACPSNSFNTYFYLLSIQKPSLVKIALNFLLWKDFLDNFIVAAT
jgi:hypothetical protein